MSQDTDVVRIVRPTLEKLAIDVEICGDARKASELLVSDKFDAVIVDCDDLRGGIEVLQGLRGTPGNKNSVAFAVLNGKKTTTQEAFGMGVNFVLQKPITTLNATRCFNAALSFMVRERRRYFRQPVKMPVNVILEEKEMIATSTNVSEGGIALMLRRALPKNATPRLQFTLPGTSQVLDLQSEIAWADMRGHAGLRFRNRPQTSQELLERWLDQQMDKALPGSREKPAGSEGSGSASPVS